jgi:hypothetical protein
MLRCLVTHVCKFTENWDLFARQEEKELCCNRTGLLHPLLGWTPLFTLGEHFVIRFQSD